MLVGIVHRSTIFTDVGTANRQTDLSDGGCVRVAATLNAEVAHLIPRFVRGAVADD